MIPSSKVQMPGLCQRRGGGEDIELSSTMSATEFKKRNFMPPNSLQNCKFIAMYDFNIFLANHCNI